MQKEAKPLHMTQPPSKSTIGRCDVWSRPLLMFQWRVATDPLATIRYITVPTHIAWRHGSSASLFMPVRKICQSSTSIGSPLSHLRVGSLPLSRPRGGRVARVGGGGVRGATLAALPA